MQPFWPSWEMQPNYRTINWHPPLPFDICYLSLQRVLLWNTGASTVLVHCYQMIHKRCWVGTMLERGHFSPEMFSSVLKSSIAEGGNHVAKLVTLSWQKEERIASDNTRPSSPQKSPLRESSCALIKETLHISLSVSLKQTHTQTHKLLPQINIKLGFNCISINNRAGAAVVYPCWSAYLKWLNREMKDKEKERLRSLGSFPTSQDSSCFSFPMLLWVVSSGQPRWEEYWRQTVEIKELL